MMGTPYVWIATHPVRWSHNERVGAGAGRGTRGGAWAAERVDCGVAAGCCGEMCWMSSRGVREAVPVTSIVGRGSNQSTVGRSQ